MLTPRQLIPSTNGKSFFLRNVLNNVRKLSSKRLTQFPLFFLGLLLVLAVVGPFVTPYEYDQTQYGPDGAILRAQPPTLDHPLGTTDSGYDVFSRLVYGARPTVLTALLGGTMIVSIGLSIGVLSGYVGGWLDTVLMRLTDVAYSMPLIPFAIVLITFLNVGYMSSIIVIGLLLWRSNARVLRSQVLQIKQRPYVTAARASGASTSRIIFKHIIPNIASMAILFFALGMGWAIIAQAGLSFIGVTNPFIPSWGVMIRNAYNSGYMAVQWGWSVPPGLMIAFTVLSAFIIGREYESDDEQSDIAFAQGG